MYSILQLREALEYSWSKDTTYCPIKFNKRKPAIGQCLVSSLVLQHYLGGDLKGTTFKEPSGAKGGHYWLFLNGLDVDLTWEQFPKGTTIKNTRKTSRERMLKLKHVRDRYNILLQRVENYLKTLK